MTQQPPSPDGRPRRREDTIRPPRTRRGGDRAPYPGARTRTTTGTPGTRASSRPDGTPPRSRRRTSTASPEPTPATVWTCGPDPIDAHETWPVPIVEHVTTAFAAPGAHVVLVDVGTDAAATTATATVGVTAPTAAPAAVVPEPVQEAVRALGRTVTTTVMDAPADASRTPARPFWADLVLDAPTPALAPAEPTTLPAHGAAADGSDAPGSSPADLVLASLPAHAAERVSLDRLALLAAGLLRYGGILAVYTHSDWNRGRLVDPTGAVVAAAQHADLLYLQHVVALHTPVQAGRLPAAPSPAVAAEYGRTTHRATVRELPAPHLRAHSDIQIFAQPTDPGTPSPDTTAEASAAAYELGHGDLR